MMNLNDLTRDELIIAWARQWAEFVSDKDVIDKWRREANFDNVWFKDENFDLREELSRREEERSAKG